MKKISTIIIFLFSISIFSQENVCDCIEVGIETLQSIERGASEETVQKRFEKQNKACDELSIKLGENFEKEMASCDNFPRFIQLMAGGEKITQPNKEVCECLNISIKILEEIEKGLKEEDITKLYEKESEFCDELSSKLGEEQFGLQMMGCENFGKLMNLLMNQSD